MTDSPDKNTDIAEISFEDAMRDLEQIADQLESGQTPLATLVELYDRGTALKSRCEFLLSQAEMKIDQIRINSKGIATGTEPLDDA